MFILLNKIYLTGWDTLKVFAKIMCCLGLFCKRNANHFFSCSNLLCEEKSINFSAFFEKIDDISDKFNDRFADFELLRVKVKLFNNSVEVDVEFQPPYFQQELSKLQLDPFLLSRKYERYDPFLKFVSQEQFPQLRNFTQKMFSMFDSTLKSFIRNLLPFFQ